MKQTFVIALGAVLFLSACEVNPSQNRYKYNEVGQSVIIEFATIVRTREVDITGFNSGGGALAGAAVGAGAGAYGGSGSGQAWSTLAGALVGGVAGVAVEQAARDAKGIEYVLVTEKGKTKTIVQYLEDEEEVFAKGDRVMVQTKGTYQRVLSTKGLPDTVKRPKGIEVID